MCQNPYLSRGARRVLQTHCHWSCIWPGEVNRAPTPWCAEVQPRVVVGQRLHHRHPTRHVSHPLGRVGGRIVRRCPRGRRRMMRPQTRCLAWTLINVLDGISYIYSLIFLADCIMIYFWRDLVTKYIYHFIFVTTDVH